MADNYWYPTTSENDQKNKFAPGSQPIYNPAYPNPNIQFQQFDYNNQNNLNIPNNQNNPNYQGLASNYQGQIFTPANVNDFNVNKFSSQLDDENEPPLLEELGINFECVKQKILTVLNPFRKTDLQIASENDLAGPLLFCLLFGLSLLLAGKIHFGYIYGISGLGSLSMYCLLNLMSSYGVSFLCIISVLGYSLLPIIMLSFAALVISLNGLVGTILILSAVHWCAASASRMFVTSLRMESQQLLIAYPCALLYGVFALLAVF